MSQIQSFSSAVWHALAGYGVEVPGTIPNTYRHTLNLAASEAARLAR